MNLLFQLKMPHTFVLKLFLECLQFHEANCT